MTGCVSQGAFLKALGIEARAQRLMQARPDAAPVIQRQLDCLTAPDQMGELFKAAAIFSPAWPCRVSENCGRFSQGV